MNLSRPKKVFIGTLLSLIISLYVIVPEKVAVNTQIFGQKINLSFTRPFVNYKIGNFDLSKEIPLKQGLDIRGGLQIVLLADMKGIGEADRPQALESLKNVISRRLDPSGVSEATIKTVINGQDYRIQVELPGAVDTADAIQRIGQTALMQFSLPVFIPGATASDSATLAGFSQTDLTGADLKSAEVTFETENRAPAVAIVFNDSGREKFAKLTKENIGKPIAILLDGYPITMPTVQVEITDGKAQITGSFTIKEAKLLADNLNGGKLPVPVSILSQKNIPATLGADSINKSIISGAIGLSMVVFFMIAYYGKMGFIATLGLLMYGIYTLAIYKLLSVVLSLPGIAGFLLSVGMAVDSNILIFERYKEEIRAGRPWQIALELGFGRAWDSIKDANTATIITGFILFNPLEWPFLNTSGSVKGFALTLIIGIFISLFTGLVVTRNFLRLFYKGKTITIKTEKK